MTDPEAATASSETTPRAAAVIQGALGTYRAEWRRVLGAALLVLFPISLTSTAAQGLTVGLPASTARGPVLDLFVILVVAAVSRTLGSVFYAGLLDRLVGHRQRGHRRMSIGEVVRTLPYRRLWIANLLLMAITAIGLVLFVIPGVFAFTLFALVGPIINIEDCPVLQGFRRSAELVRPYIPLVLLLATIPALAEHLSHELVHLLLEHQPDYVVAVVLDGLLAGTLGAFLGLIEVTLAYELGARGHHRGAASETA